MFFGEVDATLFYALYNNSFYKRKQSYGLSVGVWPGAQQQHRSRPARSVCGTSNAYAYMHPNNTTPQSIQIKSDWKGWYRF